ncbi:MAG: DUF2490 domain-containing protein [Flavobacteriales bacterium]
MYSLRSILPILVSVLATIVAHSQSGTNQLWVDGTVGSAFAAYYKGEMELGYRAVVPGDTKWESLRVIPRVEAAPTAHWTFLLGTPAIYSEQENALKSFEVRALLGAKYNFTPFKRVQSRLNLRYEYRRIQQSGGSEAQLSPRLRLRAEFLVPLDTRNYRSDSMWYALADAEAFVTLDKLVDEPFASRARFRVGLGRKFSYNWWAEMIYNLQESRNSLTDDDPAIDNIIRLRVKYYVTPRSRSKKAEKR